MLLKLYKNFQKFYWKIGKIVDTLKLQNTIFIKKKRIRNKRYFVLTKNIIKSIKIIQMPIYDILSYIAHISDIKRNYLSPSGQIVKVRR